MAYLFTNFKADLRARLFPGGTEASNQRIAHDKAIVDGLIDIQQLVDCSQVDQTTIVPHCATFYNCGLTVLDAPRGRIKKVSVIDTTPAGSPAGDELFSEDFDVTLEGDPVVPTSIGTVTAGGKLIIEVKGASGECGDDATVLSYNGTTPTFVDAGKQYFNVTVIYTDLNSVSRQVVKRVPISECNSLQYESVNIKTGTLVYVSIVAFNLPANTGSATITVLVKEPAAYVAPEADDWCSEIEYRQIDPHYVQNYFNIAKNQRCCPSLVGYFDLPYDYYCLVPNRATTAKDYGLPGGLALLPLGYHFAQADTDRRTRSKAGLWAIERGKLYLVPWIQSTEKVVIKWDGIKREWNDDDPIDSDPLLLQAVTEWVRADHAKNFERDYEAAAAALGAYTDARSRMAYECREENRIRGNEPSFARQSAGSVGITLFYNTKQTATAVCPSGTTGDSVVVTVEAGTIASSVSQDDANSKAMAQAHADAQAQLNCVAPLQVYYNTIQSYTARCRLIDPTPAGTPEPDGANVTVTKPAGTYSSTISQANANAKALAAATEEAEAQLVCTWWNAAQSYTASCPLGESGASVTKTVAARTHSSTISLDLANAAALNDAKGQAEEALVCTGGSGGANTYWNLNTEGTFTLYSFNKTCFGKLDNRGQIVRYSVSIRVFNHRFSSIISQADANQQAYLAAKAYAESYLTTKCNETVSGSAFPPNNPYTWPTVTLP